MEYEFDEDQNVTIEGLAEKMGVVGLFLWLTGLLVLVISAMSVYSVFMETPKLPERVPDALSFAVDEFNQRVESNRSVAFVGGVAGILNGFLLLVGGTLTRRAAHHFRQVVQTRGTDIANMMDALNALRSFFGIGSTLLLIGLAAGSVTMTLTIYFKYTAGG